MKNIAFVIVKLFFWINSFIISWGMVGYGESLKVFKNKSKRPNRDYLYKPTVTVIIVAHNEEKVILDKLENIINNDYPKDCIEYIIASDWSTDKTNQIVIEFISNHPEIEMTLLKSREHKGKTNAQNEAQKVARGKILVMSDANSMFKYNAISELVASFSDNKIVYVTGRLNYINQNNETAASESLYWERDLEQRLIESNIYTITAGNGAIYACRNSNYIDFDPIDCHDSAMPYKYGSEGLRCIYNPDAIAYEKAGETNKDEFKRKVRMNRDIISSISKGIKVINPIGHAWFSYFYFGHRTCRYILWISHIIIYITCAMLIYNNVFYNIAFWSQTIFYLVAIFDLMKKPHIKIVNLIGYYTMTIVAQVVGAYNEITGKSKPIWDKAESTR